MRVPFCVVCDKCGAESRQYGFMPSCRECLLDTCEVCAVLRSIDEETGRCMCLDCELYEIAYDCFVGEVSL